MLGYIVKRLILSVVTIFIIITVTFFMMHAVPSSPFNKPKAITPAVFAALEAKYGLDKPLGEQYLVYLGNVLQLDFGTSIYFRGRSVISLIFDGLKVSGVLGLWAAGFALVVGMVLGSVAALKRDSWLDRVILVITTAATSLPSFVVAVLLLWTFGVWWPILPTRGDQPGGYILPIIALALYPTAYVTRLMRSSMLDVLGQDYIRTAYAKGVKRPGVVFKHALKNALTPVISYAGPMIAYIVTGSFVVEMIFSMGGLGKYFVASIQNSDYTLIMGTTIFLSIIMIAMNLICDILYTVVDKRVELA
ncbi:MAG: ABC transporter permease [Ruminococcaceae bacterium]|nr:ABC transporter permease [Oscillospiraceae bacterium]